MGYLKLAAEMSNIQSFIEELPKGYNTKIGPDGMGLSQGQKQRLLIARAIYKNPDFIFFDEATNALDANNKAVIVDNMKAFFKNRTVVVVAHRLSTVFIERCRAFANFRQSTRKPDYQLPVRFRTDRSRFTHEPRAKQRQ